MYAMIRKYQFDQSKGEDVDRKIQEMFLPLLEKVPGFVTYYWLDTGEGSGASLTVFQDKAGVEESLHIAANFVRDHMAGIEVSSPEVTQGEVRAHA
ncbi:MAG: hypothetical protein ABW096_04455 [Candidatus Thiodiazotropha sp.]